MKDEKELLLAKNCSYSMNCRETQLNNNVIIVGSSGCGKTRSIVSPNIWKKYGSYVISDPKGNLYDKHKRHLMAAGYRVLKLDFVHPEESDHYNPFRYIRSEKDVKTIAHMLSFEAGETTSHDPFWRRNGELLLTSLIGSIWKHHPYCDRNLATVFELLTLIEIRDEESSYKSQVDILFDHYEKDVPGDIFVKAYRNYRCLPNHTGMCIKSESVSRIGAFISPEMNKMLGDDNIDISSLGDSPTAVFVVVSDTDRSMDGLANLFFTQAIHELCRKADDTYGGALPYHTRFIMDDFATNVKIGEFPRMISSFRSRNISSMIIIQAESQLKSLYNYDAETIITNCDSYVYLGGSDVDTARNVGRRCRKDLQTILYMPIGSVWVFRRGSKPVYTVQNEPFTEETYMLKERKKESLLSGLLSLFSNKEVIIDEDEDEEWDDENEEIEDDSE